MAGRQSVAQCYCGRFSEKQGFFGLSDSVECFREIHGRQRGIRMCGSEYIQIYRVCFPEVRNCGLRSTVAEIDLPEAKMRGGCIDVLISNDALQSSQGVQSDI